MVILRQKQEKKGALGLQTPSLLVCRHYQEKKEVRAVEEPLQDLAPQEALSKQEQEQQRQMCWERRGDLAANETATEV